MTTHMDNLTAVSPHMVRNGAPEGDMPRQARDGMFNTLAMRAAAQDAAKGLDMQVALASAGGDTTSTPNVAQQKVGKQIQLSG